jgi:hypothetical protein
MARSGNGAGGAEEGDLHVPLLKCMESILTKKPACTGFGFICGIR